MSNYEQAVEILASGRDHTMTVSGNSMLPLIESGSALTFRKVADYRVGDVVFCKVKGRWIGAHKVTKIDAEGRFMIANNKGFENGWTKQVFGRVIAVNGAAFGRPAG